MSKCKELCGRHDCKRLGCAEHRNGMGKHKKRKSIAAVLFGALALIILLIAMYQGIRAASAMSIITDQQPQPQLPDVSVMYECSHPVYYVVSFPGTDFPTMIVPVTEIEKNSRVGSIVISSMIVMENANVAPTSIFMDVELGRQCA
jgi:hypothetical protein